MITDLCPIELSFEKSPEILEINQYLMKIPYCLRDYLNKNLMYIILLCPILETCFQTNYFWHLSQCYSTARLIEEIVGYPTPDVDVRPEPLTTSHEAITADQVEMFRLELANRFFCDLFIIEVFKMLIIEKL